MTENYYMTEIMVSILSKAVFHLILFSSFRGLIAFIAPFVPGLKIKLEK